MGKMRARSKQEQEKRTQEIVETAKDLFMKADYYKLTLTSIAKNLGLSRPALYSYFKSKEDLLLAISKDEYLELSKDLKDNFQNQISNEKFCKTLIDIFFNHPLFIKLISLHQSAMEASLGLKKMQQFKKDSAPFFYSFYDALKIQFPNSTEQQRYLFLQQFTVLLPTIYPYVSVPQEQFDMMMELGLFGKEKFLSGPDFYLILIQQLIRPLVQGKNNKE